MITRGRKVLLGLALAAFASLVSSIEAGAQALPDVRQCIAHLDPTVDIGYDRIAARCPDLTRGLEQGTWSAWLPRGWKESGNDLSAGGLTELRELVRREDSATPQGRVPDVQQLRNSLATLGVGAGSDGAWGRFKRWLRSILESRQQPEQEGWFSKMVSHAGFTQSVIDLIVYATLAVVVVLAAIIVGNELRSAGLLHRRGRVASLGKGTTGLHGESPEWGDVESAPLRERPRLLLGLVTRRLSERGFLPPPGGLTVRELTRLARLPESDDRGRLSELALSAEQVRYSDQVAPEETLRKPLARGKELLDRLDTSVPR
jgi:hypothetical protein